MKCGIYRREKSSACCHASIWYRYIIQLIQRTISNMKELVFIEWLRLFHYKFTEIDIYDMFNHGENRKCFSRTWKYDWHNWNAQKVIKLAKILWLRWRLNRWNYMCPLPLILYFTLWLVESVICAMIVSKELFIELICRLIVWHDSLMRPVQWKRAQIKQTSDKILLIST